MDNPSITVVVPTFQRREMVIETVRALCQVEYDGEFEIVVVVDGSTDGTGAALVSLESPVPVRVIEQENRGLAAARNRGAAEAGGEVLLFLDDDMTCEPSLLAHHASAYRDGADAVVGDFTEEAGPGAGFLAERPERRSFQRHDAPLSAFDMFGGHLSVRRSAFEQVGGYDESFTTAGRYGCEDFDLGHRLLQRFTVHRNAGAVCDHRKRISPREYILRARSSANAEAYLVKKHPELADELIERTHRTAMSNRLRLLSRIPMLPGMFAEFAAALAWIGSRTRFRSSHGLAYLCHAAYALNYWSTVRQNGGFPES